MSAFEKATAVRRRSVDVDYERSVTGLRYDVELDLGWSIGGKPNGGYLLAILARAACDGLERPHPLAVSGHFLRPPEGGAAEIRVETVKSGRTAATARATLWQNGRPCLDTLTTAGELANEPPEFEGLKMPPLPPPEECEGRSNAPFPVAILDHVDVRIDPATSPARPNGNPVIRGWLAFHDGADHDAMALPLAVDVMPPTIFHLKRLGWAPTVELTFLLRGLPASGWLAFQADATTLADGWFDENAAIWDSTGRLVAQSRQLALVGRS
jgi:acyl-CoA thioesterase